MSWLTDWLLGSTEPTSMKFGQYFCTLGPAKKGFPQIPPLKRLKEGRRSKWKKIFFGRIFLKLGLHILFHKLWNFFTTFSKTKPVKELKRVKKGKVVKMKNGFFGLIFFLKLGIHILLLHKLWNFFTTFSKVQFLNKLKSRRREKWKTIF